MTKFVYKLSFFEPSSQLLLLPITLSNYIFKVVKSLFNIQKESITWFAIYHPYYKDKFNNLT